MNRSVVFALGVVLASPAIGCDGGSGGAGGSGSSTTTTTTHPASGSSTGATSSSSTGAVFPDACPDNGTYAWDLGVSGSSGTTWSISGTVHLLAPLGEGTVCMLFSPYVPATSAGGTASYGLGVCLPQQTWDTSDITYRWTSNVPGAPIDETVEFFVDQNGDGTPTSGEIHGWFDGSSSTPIHAGDAARPIHIEAGNCPQHVDFGVGPLP